MAQKTNYVTTSASTSSLSAKTAKDIRQAAKAAKQAKKDAWDALTKEEKQAIRDAQVAAAVPIIDTNITDAAKADRTFYEISKSDALIADLDNKAITQLAEVYTAIQDGQAFVVTDTGSSMVFDWS